jgi:hypothetical protein
MLNKRIGAGAPALRSLDARLEDVVSTVPSTFLGLIREVTIWIEPGDAETDLAPTEQANDVYYLPLNVEAHFASYFVLPRKAGGIEIHAPTRLLEPIASRFQECTPGWLLHEFAHALHDRLLGMEHAKVKAVFGQASDRKLYRDVEIRMYGSDGQFATRRAAAYARTNPLEYFAELSVAYLGMGKSIFPYTREDLQKYDRAGYDLMEEFWRSRESTVINEFPFPVSVHRVAETGRRFRLCDLLPAKEKAFGAWAGMGLVATDLLDGTEYQFPDADEAEGKWRLRPR